jgi:hypothetical protein
MCFGSVAKVIDCLDLGQIRDISEIAIGFLLEANPAEDQKEAALGLLSRLRITDPQLVSVDVGDFNNLALLVSCFPRSGSFGDIAVSRVRDLIDRPLNEERCALLFGTISEFVGDLSDDSHQILVDVVIHAICRRGFAFQKCISSFFLSIPEHFESIYVMDFGNVSLCGDLKAASIRLHYLAQTRPTFSVDLDECFTTGCSLFSIGEYSQAIKSLSMCKGNLRADALQFLARGEDESRHQNHSAAASCFRNAMSAFQATSFQHDFHVMYCEARFCYESICFQAELFIDAGVTDFESYVTEIDRLYELASGLLSNSSLLLYPDIDLTSREFVDKFCDQAHALIGSIQQPDAFRDAKAADVIPPPALLQDLSPITIKALEILDPILNVAAADEERQFMLTMTGSSVAEVDVSVKLICELAFPKEGALLSGGVQELECGCDFEMNFFVICERSLEAMHSMPLKITFQAITDAGEHYLVGHFTKCVCVNENAND